MASMPKKQIEAVPVEESVAADTDRPANGSDRVALQRRPVPCPGSQSAWGGTTDPAGHSRWPAGSAIRGQNH
jgi:hypothetical protein